MSADTERLIAEALQFGVEERLYLVDRLLQSLDDEDTSQLDAQDRARLNAALDLSEQQFKAGQSVPAEEILARLRPSGT